MTPGYAKPRAELPWLYYPEADSVIINAHNFGGDSPLLTDLVSYWTLNEASGNAIDSHASNVLTAAGGPGAAAGKIGTARTFNASQYFSRASDADVSVGDTDFTFSFWVNFSDISTFRHILTKWNAATSDREYLIRLSNTGVMQFFVSPNGSSSTSVDAVTAGALTTGVWYFVACWHDSDADTISIEVDGDLDSAAHASGVLNGSSEFLLGSPASKAGTLHSGLIDEVGFWRRVLTADERSQLRGGGDGLAYPFN